MLWQVVYDWLSVAKQYSASLNIHELYRNFHALSISAFQQLFEIVLFLHPSFLFSERCVWDFVHVGKNCQAQDVCDKPVIFSQ